MAKQERKSKQGGAGVTTKDGLAVVVLQGKHRHEDNTEAVHAGLAAAGSSNGMMLVFQGEGVLGPFPVLELCDRLQELRAAGKRLVTVAHSWLGAPDLLLWLQGGERFLTASGYGHVRVPPWSKYHALVAEKAAIENPDPFWAEFLEPEEAPQLRRAMEDPRNYAYDQVLERLNEFFAVPDYVNKVVPRKDLAELGLITGEGLDKMLLDVQRPAEKGEGVARRKVTGVD